MSACLWVGACGRGIEQLFSIFLRMHLNIPSHRMRATPGGTFWYHSHHGYEFTMGLHGPLIVISKGDSLNRVVAQRVSCIRDMHRFVLTLTLSLLVMATIRDTILLTLIPTWISNHMPSKMSDEITYSFPRFNGCTVEDWKWMSNFAPQFVMDIITYPFWY